MLRCHDSYRDLPADCWDALVPADEPFLRHAFLNALEESGAVGPAQGWQPAPVLLTDAQGTLRAAMPGWIKHHSRGEYVFDHDWAEASLRAGIRYYPKWLSAVPFTPVTGKRLLSVDQPAAIALLDGLDTLPALAGVSGFHVNFTSDADNACFALAAEDARGQRWLQRQDCQFQWHNAGYRDFADFTADLTSDRRKKIRQERQKLSGLGLEFSWVTGKEMTEALLDDIHACYANTYLVRGQRPYLNRLTFSLLCRDMADALQFLCVRRAGRTVAMSLFVTGSETLYGRYWGCLEEVPLLHFEACFYQGITRAIALGLKRFDAGAQGEHKLVRGFSPVLTSSWHRLRHPGLHGAVSSFLQREREAVADYRLSAQAACPFRQTPALGTGRPAG